jgi:hypothetical protein
MSVAEALRSFRLIYWQVAAAMNHHLFGFTSKQRQSLLSQPPRSPQPEKEGQSVVIDGNGGIFPF